RKNDCWYQVHSHTRNQRRRENPAQVLEQHTQEESVRNNPNSFQAQLSSSQTHHALTIKHQERCIDSRQVALYGARLPTPNQKDAVLPSPQSPNKGLNSREDLRPS